MIIMFKVLQAAEATIIIFMMLRSPYCSHPCCLVSTFSDSNCVLCCTLLITNDEIVGVHVNMHTLFMFSFLNMDQLFPL